VLAVINVGTRTGKYTWVKNNTETPRSPEWENEEKTNTSQPHRQKGRTKTPIPSLSS